MPETGTSGSMSGMWKRSKVRIVRHRQTKGPATDRPNLTHRATSRLHHLACEIRALLVPFFKVIWSGVYRSDTGNRDMPREERVEWFHDDDALPRSRSLGPRCRRQAQRNAPATASANAIEK